MNNTTSCYGSSCANNGKGALNTQETLPCSFVNTQGAVARRSLRLRLRCGKHLTPNPLTSVMQRNTPPSPK
eukprot:1195453-Prorocentrum_minimum.AAC.5